MSLTTPTTKDIRDNIIAQLETTLGQTVPILPKSFLRVLSVALAGVFTLLYKYGGYIYLQMFVQTASPDSTQVNGVAVSPLSFWGDLVGVGSPTAATRAELIIDIAVENQVGTLPAGSQLLGATNGVTYITLAAVLLNAATVQATIRAVSDEQGGGGEGTIGNLDAAAVVSFASPLANIARDAVVSSALTVGADAEATEVYRGRVLDRFRKRPQGGALSDYEAWGSGVEGIVNIYPYTSNFPGQVDVYVEATVASSGSADGIPTTPQLTAVLTALKLDSAGVASRRPAGALVNTFPISRLVFDVTVAGLTVDNSAQVQTDITAAIGDYLRGREPFIEGLSTFPRKDRVSRSGIGGVVDDIVSASGGVFNSVTVRQSAVAIEIFSLGVGVKAKAGAISFV